MLDSPRLASPSTEALRALPTEVLTNLANQVQVARLATDVINEELYGTPQERLTVAQAQQLISMTIPRLEAIYTTLQSQRATT